MYRPFIVCTVYSAHKSIVIGYLPAIRTTVFLYVMFRVKIKLPQTSYLGLCRRGIVIDWHPWWNFAKINVKHEHKTSLSIFQFLAPSRMEGSMHPSYGTNNKWIQNKYKIYLTVGDCSFFPHRICDIFLRVQSKHTSYLQGISMQGIFVHWIMLIDVAVFPWKQRHYKMSYEIEEQNAMAVG